MELVEHSIDGKKYYCWDENTPRRKGYFRNLWEAVSQLWSALFLNGHANLSTSAQAGRWQLAGYAIRGHLLAWVANHFIWFFSLDAFRGKRVDHSHCINAWKDKV